MKPLSKQTGKTLKELSALSVNAEPYRMGTPTHIKRGKWFANMWTRFGKKGHHLRELHYQIISSGEQIKVPTHKKGGELYRNDKPSWRYLQISAKHARHLLLVDPAKLAEKRNPDPIVNVRFNNYQNPRFKINKDDSKFSKPQMEASISSPTLDFPTLKAKLSSDWWTRLSQASLVEDYRPYLLEIWVEKTGLNHILEPICKSLGINLHALQGHASITSVAKFIERVKEAQRPAHIMYISDHDLSGESMAPAVARKIEYLKDVKDLDIEVSLEKILITAKQVEKYELPRAPDTNAVELNALEALHSGEAERIIKKQIELLTSAKEEKIETELQEKQDKAKEIVNSVEKRVKEKFEERRDKVLKNMKTVVEEYRKELTAKTERIEKELMKELKPHVKEQRDLNSEIADFVEREIEEAELPKIPERKSDFKDNGYLFSSDRSYLDQLEKYKEYKRQAQSDLS